MSQRSYEILIVDDAKTMRMIVEAILSTMDANFDHAADGKEAFQAVVEKQYDLIITDIHMPIMTGLEFCDKARNELRFKNLPIMVMTTDNSYDTVEKVFEAGANDFITKPINELELRSRVNRILEQRRIEKALYIAKNEANQANLRKSEYLANVNHELKTPLNGIYGYSQILQSMEQDPEKRSMVDMIVKASVQMTSMINQLLQLEQIESGKISLKKEPIRILDLLQGCLSLFKVQLQQQNIKVQHNLDASMVINSDKEMVQSILSNLLSNAMKYNIPAGSIEVKGIMEEGGFRLNINDTGIGMDAKQLARIYEPFSRFCGQSRNAAKRHIEGHGLGMAITKSSIDALDVNMSIESEIDKGTQISLIFP